MYSAFFSGHIAQRTFRNKRRFRDSTGNTKSSMRNGSGRLDNTTTTTTGATTTTTITMTHGRVRPAEGSTTTPTPRNGGVTSIPMTHIMKSSPRFFSIWTDLQLQIFSFSPPLGRWHPCLWWCFSFFSSAEKSHDIKISQHCWKLVFTFGLNIQIILKCYG